MLRRKANRMEGEELHMDKMIENEGGWNAGGGS